MSPFTFLPKALHLVPVANLCMFHAHFPAWFPSWLCWLFHVKASSINLCSPACSIKCWQLKKESWIYFNIWYTSAWLYKHRRNYKYIPSSVNPFALFVLSSPGHWHGTCLCERTTSTCGLTLSRRATAQTHASICPSLKRRAVATWSKWEAKSKPGRSAGLSSTATDAHSPTMQVGL